MGSIINELSTAIAGNQSNGPREPDSSAGHAIPYLVAMQQNPYDGESPV